MVSKSSITSTATCVLFVSALALGTGTTLEDTVAYRSCISAPASCTQLRLIGLNITGPLPSDLSRLTALTTLALSSNSITGTLPSEIGLLTALNYPWLDSNSLTGTIPTEEDLAMPPCTGTVRTWYLNDNRISGSIPTEIGMLKYLALLL
ncbi:hypothetical protein CYMTET_16794 [Cymbomonas tetramitiformis]|uniref:L domain-like protein n=1 Tax=Cymbomonas tetramitiformis TaxID=36881 RepID=A0AAE0GCP8_9CHLO|nr:hypothetical protein CYMTET_16794 [Cymbomonas tetramitiformis]